MRRSRLTRGVVTTLLLIDLAWAGACNVGDRDANTAGSPEGTVSTERAAITEDRHLLLIVERAPSGFKILEVHVVASPLPRTRAPRSLGWRADIEDGAGRSLFSVSIPESGIRRGVFAGTDKRTESTQTRLETFSFALRLPLVPDAARIRFWDTSLDEPRGALHFGSSTPAHGELGGVPYPKDVQ
jgi:hypothetical protein